MAGWLHSQVQGPTWYSVLWEMREVQRWELSGAEVGLLTPRENAGTMREPQPALTSTPS